MGSFDFMAFVAALTQLSADVRNKAGLMTVIADAVAVLQLFTAGGTPDPAPPALTAHLGAGGNVSSEAVADQIDAEVADLHKVGAPAVVGKFGDGSLLAKFLPVILKAIMAAFTGA